MSWNKNTQKSITIYISDALNPDKLNDSKYQIKREKDRKRKHEYCKQKQIIYVRSIGDREGGGNFMRNLICRPALRAGKNRPSGMSRDELVFK